MSTFLPRDRVAVQAEAYGLLLGSSAYAKLVETLYPLLLQLPFTVDSALDPDTRDAMLGLGVTTGEDLIWALSDRIVEGAVSHALNAYELPVSLLPLGMEAGPVYLLPNDIYLSVSDRPEMVTLLGSPSPHSAVTVAYGSDRVELPVSDELLAGLTIPDALFSGDIHVSYTYLPELRGVSSGDLYQENGRYTRAHSGREPYPYRLTLVDDTFEEETVLSYSQPDFIRGLDTYSLWTGVENIYTDLHEIDSTGRKVALVRS
jgi:hypothetical protein